MYITDCPGFGGEGKRLYTTKEEIAKINHGELGYLEVHYSGINESIHGCGPAWWKLRGYPSEPPGECYTGEVSTINFGPEGYNFNTDSYEEIADVLGEFIQEVDNTKPNPDKAISLMSGYPLYKWVYNQ